MRISLDSCGDNNLVLSIGQLASMAKAANEMMAVHRYRGSAIRANKKRIEIVQKAASQTCNDRREVDDYQYGAQS